MPGRAILRNAWVVWKGTVLLGIARNKALYVRFGLDMGLLPQSGSGTQKAYPVM